MTPRRGAPDEVRVVESPHMTERVEDWSRVRSPARARRRRRLGFRQNIVTVDRPMTHAQLLPNGYLAMHPELARRLREAIDAGVGRDDLIVPLRDHPLKNPYTGK